MKTSAQLARPGCRSGWRPWRVKTPARPARRGGRKHLVAKTTLLTTDHRSLITDNAVCGREPCGFTVMELLTVTGIMALLFVLIAPAFTNIKSAGDVTSAAYTIKGVLEQARSYAMANNTYTWVGFAGSIGASSVTGQVSIAAIASNDGTSSGTAAQLGNLIQLQNTHIGDTGVPSNNGTEFESRPNVLPAYRISSAGTGPPFTVQVGSVQTTFDRWVRFGPRGEALVSGATQIAQYAEVGVLPTHGSTLAVTPNIVAIEIGGLGGSLKIYRR